MNDDKQLSDEEIFLSEETQTPETPEAPVEETKAAQEEPIPEVSVEPEQEEPKAIEPKQEEAQSETNVPSWRLREEREAREAAAQALEVERKNAANLQAQMAQLQRQISEQQQKPAPDIFEDPTGWQDSLRQQQQEQQRQFAAQIQRVEALAVHGQSTVDEAWAAAVQAEVTQPHVAARIANSLNPFSEAVRWHKEQSVQKEIGEAGIDGFKGRIREELMSDPEFRKSVFEEMRKEAGVTVAETQPQTIPSLGKAPRTVTPEGAMPKTDEELFYSA